ncbi:hypothetical protein H8959_014117 [Pygathrix nigripes]
MSLYRSVVWFTKGLREDTKSGYESASKDFVPHNLEVQVPGRVFLVTGGNSGTGKATALEIAKQDKQLLTHVSTEPHGQTVASPHRGGYPVSQADGTVHLVCRDQALAEDARGEIIQESGNQALPGISCASLLMKRPHSTAASGLLLVGSPHTKVWGQVRANGPHISPAGPPEWGFLLPPHGMLFVASGMRQAMPGFHARFRDHRRSEAQGTDTVLWLAGPLLCRSRAAQQPLLSR